MNKNIPSCAINFNASRGPSPIPEDGTWVQAKEIKDISGFSHGIGGCAPQQGACKLTLNIKNGIIMEALVETLGCSGMTQSAAMASEILIGKTLLEALNTDLVCDAINVAMKNIFLQLVYGRSQSAFSIGGLEIGAGIEDLGKHKMSSVGTVYSSSKTGPRYLQLAEGYILELALDSNKEIIGYKYCNNALLIELLQSGVNGSDAIKQSSATYGRYEEGVQFINPREM